MKEKPLIIMNGRWKDRRHVYVAANSKADAARLLTQANDGHGDFRHEINKYFSVGCWGLPMEGVAVERGVWLQTDNEKPVRVI